MKSLATAFVNWLGLVIAAWITAFLFGYFMEALGWSGLWTLASIVLISCGILCACCMWCNEAAIIKYETCLLAMWLGHWVGSVTSAGSCEMEWFCISFLWPWLFLAVVGCCIVVSMCMRPRKGTERKRQAYECSAERNEERKRGRND